MKSAIVFLAVWIGAFSYSKVALAMAETTQPEPDNIERGNSIDDPEEPSNLILRIEERRTQKDSLFPVSPLGWLHQRTDQAKQALYDATGLMMGFTLTHLFQGLSDALPNEDHWGTATTSDLLGTWDLINKGQPSMGQAVFHFQGRWDYGTTGPGDLGGESLGSLIGTANTFAEYEPHLLLRNLYWRQGSPEAGWAYRFGKITPDALLGSSSHLGASTTFLTTASTGPFVIALPDSGLGAVGAWYINDRATLVGLVSDANADRFDFGDPGAGDFFKAVELHYKIAPRTAKAGYSKLTLWQTDGTEDGLPINGSNGPSGWGIYAKHEQELTDDGRAIGILRYGKSFNDSAFYRQLFSAQFLLYDPPGPSHLQNDLLGLAFNWVDATNGVRSEYDLEVFYRFPIFPSVDTTFSYQHIIDPALDLGINHASVFSLRLRTTF